MSSIERVLLVGNAIVCPCNNNFVYVNALHAHCRYVMPLCARTLFTCVLMSTHCTRNIGM